MNFFNQFPQTDPTILNQNTRGYTRGRAATAPFSYSPSPSSLSPYKRNVITNKLQHLLSQQEQQTKVNSSNTTSNFYTITQYILQTYFKVDLNSLSSLKLIDLIVDQTYPDSLTLRKLHEGSSVQPYEYFNTVSRDSDISKCPLFALAIYFIIRWSHPNPPISIYNYSSIPLLDPEYISLDSNPLLYGENPDLSNINSNVKIARSESFEPSRELIDIVFPWLPYLRQEMLLVDRTNYKLHSLCELFEFMGRIVIQDLRYLNHHALLLPNILSFIANFIPDLFQNHQFKAIDQFGTTNITTNDVLTSSMRINDNRSFMNGINNENNNIPISNDYKIPQEIESRFLELSKKLTVENVRLSQQVTQLKSELSSITAMCDQILHGQQELILQNNNTSTSRSDNTRVPEKDRIMITNVDDQAESINKILGSLTNPESNPMDIPLHPSSAVPSPSISASEQVLPSSNMGMKSSYPSPLIHQQRHSPLQKRRFPSLPIPTTKVKSPFSPTPATSDSPFAKRQKKANVDKLTPSQTALEALLPNALSSDFNNDKLNKITEQVESKSQAIIQRRPELVQTKSMSTPASPLASLPGSTKPVNFVIGGREDRANSSSTSESSSVQIQPINNDNSVRSTKISEKEHLSGPVPVPVSFSIPMKPHIGTRPTLNRNDDSTTSMPLTPIESTLSKQPSSLDEVSPKTTADVVTDTDKNKATQKKINTFSSKSNASSTMKWDGSNTTHSPIKLAPLKSIPLITKSTNLPKLHKMNHTVQPQLYANLGTFLNKVSTKSKRTPPLNLGNPEDNLKSGEDRGEEYKETKESVASNKNGPNENIKYKLAF